jgi:rubrerythrin
MTRTDDNLKTAFANESQANIEYLAYAHQAMDEGLLQIAQLFREAAGAEIVHALNHLNVMGVIKTTRQNLEDAAEGEDFEVKSIYPKFIQEAEDEARQDAVNSFRIAYEREKHHRSMFRQALRQLR